MLNFRHGNTFRRARPNVHHSNGTNLKKPKKEVQVLRFGGPMNVFQWLDTHQGMRPRIRGDSALGRAISNALMKANPRDVLVVRKDSPEFATSFTVNVQKIGTGPKGPIYKVIGGSIRLSLTMPEARTMQPAWKFVQREAGLMLSPEMFLSKSDPLFAAVKRAFKERPSEKRIVFQKAYGSGLTIGREFERVNNRHGIFYHLSGVAFDFLVNPGKNP